MMKKYPLLFLSIAMLANGLTSPILANESEQSFEEGNTSTESMQSESLEQIETESAEITPEAATAENRRLESLIGRVDTAVKNLKTLRDNQKAMNELSAQITDKEASLKAEQAILDELNQKKEDLESQLDELLKEPETPAPDQSQSEESKSEETAKETSSETSFEDDSKTEGDSGQNTDPDQKTSTEDDSSDNADDSSVKDDSSDDQGADSTDPSMPEAPKGDEDNTDPEPEPTDPDKPVAPAPDPDANQKNEQIKALQDEISRLNGEITKLEDSVNKKQGELDELNRKKADLEKKLTVKGPEVPKTAPVSAPMPGKTPNLEVLAYQLTVLESRIAGGDSATQIDTDLKTLRETFVNMETVSIYRLYNPNSGEHFYTPDAHEKDVLAKLGWNYEGVGWMSPKNDKSQPVYRLYNPNAGDHHYTPEVKERDALKKVGWKDEGIGWYSDPYGGVAILRAYNPNAKAGAHHFTDNAIERDALVRLGWKNEKVGFYSRFLFSLNKAGEKTAWIDLDGKPLGGEKQIGGYWYFFQSANGVPVEGLYTIPGTDKARYYAADGKHQGGPYKINNVWYDFDSGSGLMTRSKIRTYSDGVVRMYGQDGKGRVGSFTVANASFVTDSEGSVTKSHLNGVPLYMQRDGRWGNQLINGLGFGGTGCVPTVLASAVQAAANVNILPIDLGRHLGAAGFMNAKVLGTLAPAVPHVAGMYGIEIERNLDKPRAERVLRSGGVIVAAMRAGLFCSPGYTHEIFIQGYDNGNVLIHDPYGFSPDGWYPLQIVFDQQSDDPLDRSAGGPIFGFYNKRFY